MTVSSAGFATQTNAKYIGFKAGYGFTATEPADGQPGFGGEAAGGYLVGITGRRPVARDFALQAELLLVRRGADFSGFTTAFRGFGEAELRDFKVEARNTFLEVPLTVQYLIPAESLGLRLFAGPSFAVTVDCSPDSIDVVLDLTDPDRVEERTIPGCPFGHGEYQAGAVAGALADFDVGSFELTLDVRYDLGFGTFDGQGYVNVFPGSLSLPAFDAFEGLQVSLGIGTTVNWR